MPTTRSRRRRSGDSIGRSWSYSRSSWVMISLISLRLWTNQSTRAFRVSSQHAPPHLRSTARYLVRDHQHTQWRPPSPCTFGLLDTHRTKATSTRLTLQTDDEFNHRSFSTSDSTRDSHTDDTPVGIGQFLDGLNPSQVQAVVQPRNAIVRVISGPGSGKTRVLTCRMAYLLLQQQQQEQELQQPNARRHPERILGVTFTRKAAGEMSERLHQLVAVPELLQQHVTLGTFHSICAKILRWNGQLLSILPSVQRDLHTDTNSMSSNITTSSNLNSDFTIIDEAEQGKILKRYLDHTETVLPPEIKQRSVLTLLSEYKDAIMRGNSNPFRKVDERTGKELPLSAVKRLVMTFYPYYRQSLWGNNCLDFDDLIELTRELLFHYPEVRQRLQRHWTHVLVDEYQDTSKSQVELVQLLTSQSLLVVGDEDQSIYSWRGAHATSLSDFDTEFAAWGPVQTVYLMENYRSTSNIIKAAQKIISHSTHPSVSVPLASESGTRTSAQEERGTDKLRQKMKPQRGAGPPPRVIRFNNDITEAKFVVKTVKDALAVGNYTDDRSVAILYRTNAQSRALEEACVQDNLPYVIVGSATSFYQRMEIKDCLCYLRWMLNGRDRTAMTRALTTPKRGIGKSALGELDEYCALVEAYVQATSAPDALAGWTPLDVLFSLIQPPGSDPNFPHPEDTFSTRSLKLFREFARPMRDLYELAYEKSLEEVLKALIDTMQLMSHFNKESKSTSEFEDRQQNVNELQQATQKYTSQGPCLVAATTSSGSTNDSTDAFPMEESPLRNFLDDVALVTDLADRSAEERFVVNLMTIHASKGKEFDTVFMVGNEEGTFPTSQALQEGSGSIVLDEEKRLFYVAMTRAKTELFMTWREEVSVFTKEGVRRVNRKRSRYLDVLVGKNPNSDSSKSQDSSKASTSRSSHTHAALRSGSDRFQSRAHDVKYRPKPYQRQWPGKPKEVVVPPVKNKLEGTASVYAQAKPVSILQSPSPSGATSTSRPRIPAVGNTTTKSITRQVSASATTRDSELVKPPTKNGRSIQTTILPNRVARKIDSTLFFPIGSTVVHKRFGKGVVLPKPTRSKSDADRNDGDDALLVHVEFANGARRQFSAKGNDLVPAL